ncbi:MAG: hypothetical protein AB1779_02230 [Candidatus Thermoplasmatota archaeon]
MKKENRLSIMFVIAMLFAMMVDVDAPMEVYSSDATIIFFIGGYNDTINISISKSAHVINASIEVLSTPIKINSSRIYDAANFTNYTMESLSVEGKIILAKLYNIIDRKVAIPDTNLSMDVTFHNNGIGLSFSNDTFFNKNVRIGEGSYTFRHSYSSIAIDEKDIIHIVFVGDDRIKNPPPIYYSNSVDGGKTFSFPLLVDNNITSRPFNPKIAVYNDAIHIIWIENRTDYFRIYYTCSKDGGKSFNKSIVLDEKIITDSFTPAAIAIDKKNSLHIAVSGARENVSGIYYYTESPDYAEFEFPIRVSNFGSAPSIAVDHKGVVHITFTALKKGFFDSHIFYSKSAENDKSFCPLIRVDDSNNQTSQLYPSIGLDSKNGVYIVWEDLRNSDGTDPDIYLAKSSDGGLSFGKNIKVDDTLGVYNPQFFPSIAIDSFDIVHVVWKDARDKYQGYHIYYSKSIDGGETFSKNIKVYDDEGNKSYHGTPSATVDSDGNVHVVWSDNRSGNWHTYYAKGTQLYHPTGSIIFPSIDLNITTAKIDKVFFNATIPKNTSIAVQYRTSLDNITWDDWEDVVNGSLIEQIGHFRYIQLKFMLSTSDPFFTPFLHGYGINYSYYAFEGYIISSPINSSFNIISVISSWKAELNSQSLNFYISNDNGTNWFMVRNEEYFEFSENGSQLIYKFEFMSDGSSTPVLYNVTINYTVESYPTNLTLDIGDDGDVEWSWNGIFDKEITISNLSKEINEYLALHKNETDVHGNVTIPLNFTSATPGTIKMNVSINYKINRAPIIINAIPDKNPTIEENEKIKFEIIAQDLDNDILAYTWYLDGNVIPEQNISSYTFYGYRGKYEIKVEVSDGELSVNHTWILTVKEKKPQIIVIEPNLILVALILFLICIAISLIFYAIYRKK